ncbi:hypothetical protein ACFL0U_01905 [Pseudomonadota bacterium]
MNKNLKRVNRALIKCEKEIFKFNKTIQKKKQKSKKDIQVIEQAINYLDVLDEFRGNIKVFEETIIDLYYE